MSRPANLDTLICNWKRVHQQTVAIVKVAPDDKYDWKPHETSMTLGTLLNHLCQSENGIAEAVVSGTYSQTVADQTSTAALVEAYEKSHAEALEKIAAIPDEKWSDLITPFGPSFEIPRIDVLNLGLEHEIHHRGQLYVYLRMLGCDVPVLFG